VATHPKGRTTLKEQAMDDFIGKRVLVTGGSRGIGLGIARAFASAGARIAVCGRKETNLMKAREELGEAITVAAHLGKAEAVEQLFQTVQKEFGGLDILVNNMGMNIFTPATAEADIGLWDKIMEGNLKSAFLCCRQAFPLMKQSGGVIINISSIAGHRAAPGMGIYGIAKAGVEMLTKVLARELASYGIRVNAVAPGMVETDFSRPFWGNDDILKELLKGIPLGRIAKVEEVVRVVTFLASDQSSYLTGEIISLAGGAEA
jgi:NAD(P)-dependent dehydrogenase (short-subunit alcohol dehydrogenase family)